MRSYVTENKTLPNFPSWTSRVRPNKDQQASVGFRDPIEAQAVENSWFQLVCTVLPGGFWVQEVAEFRFWRVVSVALVCSGASWTW
jgi:hypothetical protein